MWCSSTDVTGLDQELDCMLSFLLTASDGEVVELMYMHVYVFNVKSAGL